VAALGGYQSALQAAGSATKDESNQAAEKESVPMDGLRFSWFGLFLS
jgi:hypothetical protein